MNSNDNAHGAGGEGKIFKEKDKAQHSQDPPDMRKY